MLAVKKVLKEALVKSNKSFSPFISLKLLLVCRDGFLIASPLYNGSFSPMLKVVFTRLLLRLLIPGEILESRRLVVSTLYQRRLFSKYRQKPTMTKVSSNTHFKGKVAGIMAISPGGLGGL